MIHGGIPHDGIEQGLLALGHGLEGDILCRLRLGDDQSGILLRKKALGNDYVEISGDRDGDEHDKQRDELMSQHDLEACLIEHAADRRSHVQTTGTAARAPCFPV